MNVQREYNAHAQRSRSLGVKPGQSDPARMLVFVLLTVTLALLGAVVVVWWRLW